MPGPAIVLCPVDSTKVHRKNMLAHFKQHHPDLIPSVPKGKVRLPHNWWEKVVAAKATTKVAASNKVSRPVVKRVPRPTVDGIMDAVLRAAHPSGAIPIKAYKNIEPLRDSIAEYVESLR